MGTVSIADVKDDVLVVDNDVDYTTSTSADREITYEHLRKLASGLPTKDMHSRKKRGTHYEKCVKGMRMDIDKSRKPQQVPLYICKKTKHCSTEEYKVLGYSYIGYDTQLKKHLYRLVHVTFNRCVRVRTKRNV